MADPSLILPTPPFDLVTVASCSAAMLAATTALHHEVLGTLGRRLATSALRPRARTLSLMLGLFTLHSAEILLYAAAFYALARHGRVGMLGTAGPPSFDVSLYFSFETYSSLGYGDIVPSGALRMLAGVEALNGLLLIGWSAGFAHGVMERASADGGSPVRRA